MYNIIIYIGVARGGRDVSRPYQGVLVFVSDETNTRKGTVPFYLTQRLN